MQQQKAYAWPAVFRVTQGGTAGYALSGGEDRHVDLSCYKHHSLPDGCLAMLLPDDSIAQFGSLSSAQVKVLAVHRNGVSEKTLLLQDTETGLASTSNMSWNKHTREPAKAAQAGDLIARNALIEFVPLAKL